MSGVGAYLVYDPAGNILRQGRGTLANVRARVDGVTLKAVAVDAILDGDWTLDVEAITVDEAVYAFADIAVARQVAPEEVQSRMGPARDAAKLRIDAAAEAIRLRYITPGSGQAMAYLQKHKEAVAFLADEQIEEAEIPAIVAEVGITGTTKYEVAQVIVNMEAIWRQASAQIDSARLAAKNAVSAAATQQDIEAAEAAFAAALG